MDASVDNGANLHHQTKRRNKILADDGQVNTQPPSFMQAEEGSMQPPWHKKRANVR